jgi:protein TonB
LLEKTKSYPLLARKRGMEGIVLVRFTIDKKGLPQDIRILKSSGYRILDEEVRKMLKKASPFPEFNKEIKIPITFKLTKTTAD